MKIKTFILLGLCLKYEAHIFSYNSQFLISKLGSQSFLPSQLYKRNTVLNLVSVKVPRFLTNVLGMDRNVNS